MTEHDLVRRLGNGEKAYDVAMYDGAMFLGWQRYLARSKIEVRADLGRRGESHGTVTYRPEASYRGQSES